MDNYVKMCDYPKIQDGWEPKVGDWTDRGLVIFHETARDAYELLIDTGKVERYEVWDKHELIYIPIIEQLMGMLGEDQGVFHIWDLVCKFWLWSNESSFCYEDSEGINIPHQSRTMQELWLAFVMHELFSKRWTGSVWEKSNETPQQKMGR